MVWKRAETFANILTRELKTLKGSRVKCFLLHEREILLRAAEWHGLGSIMAVNKLRLELNFWRLSTAPKWAGEKGVV
jgi:hypothetical protein